MEETGSYFEEKTTKLQDDIETHNANIQKHQETVEEHESKMKTELKNLARKKDEHTVAIISNIFHRKPSVS